MLAHRRRLAATAVAVILGVALITGTLVLTDTINQTFSGLYTTVYQGTDAVVRAQAAFTGPRAAARNGPRWTPAWSPRCARSRAWPPTRARSGVHPAGRQERAGSGQPGQRRADAGPQLEPGGCPQPVPPGRGSRPAGRRAGGDRRQERADGHLAVGDTTTVLASGPPRRVQVAGIASFGTADSPGGASVVLFTTPVAQRLLAAPGKFGTIAFAARPGVSQAQLARNLRAALPAGLEAVTGAAGRQRGPIQHRERAGTSQHPAPGASPSPPCWSGRS